MSGPARSVRQCLRIRYRLPNLLPSSSASAVDEDEGSYRPILSQYAGEDASESVELLSSLSVSSPEPVLDALSQTGSTQSSKEPIKRCQSTYHRVLAIFHTTSVTRVVVAANVGLSAWLRGINLPVSSTTLVGWPAIEMLMLYID